MRLRYLRVKNYPPITDSEITFASGSPLGRECAIRFVVGLNGSGKSNLLRAVAEIFLALADLRITPFPVTLCYELGIRGSANHRTILLHAPGTRSGASLWVRERFVFDDDANQLVFAELLQRLEATDSLEADGFRPLIARGEWPLRETTPPQLALPMTVLAYTTGDIRPWRSVWSRNQFGNNGLNDAENENEERPAGWTEADELAIEAIRKEGQRAVRLAETAKQPAEAFRRPILLDPVTLKCALLAIVLPHSLRTPRETDVSAPDRPDVLQCLLERGGWYRLMCVGFRSRFNLQDWDRQLRNTATEWWSCASEVVSEPHPTEARRTLFFDLNGSLRAGDLRSSPISDLLETVESPGDALLALLGGREETPLRLFTRLLSLKAGGLFDDVLLRLRRQPSAEEESEEAEQDVGILRFEELSDGEQMVLSRMALFHLLQGETDALLLLDEPETHFNDKWKREIVDIIDDAIGQTANDVLISTHSAIVLSDVFSNEIVMVEKTDTGSEVSEVTVPTFATDPSALMMTVFDADDSIGKRAQEFIERMIEDQEGSSEKIVYLESLINKMGSGFYRSELRTLLNRWRRNA